ncbi:MAG: hypothetical protein EZS28_030933 [Streblomastix strix]|uniref:Uncharacterized protein n=1 Tax=Streblomastix strix TaxID=222440 RepID=A0A5J4UTQ0_9EUKA|nr:MAG: hypothetical protein EZS28_030933 [Streblomastix strix]
MKKKLTNEEQDKEVANGGLNLQDQIIKVITMDLDQQKINNQNNLKVNELMPDMKIVNQFSLFNMEMGNWEILNEISCMMMELEGIMELIEGVIVVQQASFRQLIDL